MFFIVNKTKSQIFIRDIGTKLGPRQALDLDKLMGREKTDASKDLIEKIREGIIEIKRKDEVEQFKFKKSLKEEKNSIAAMKKELIKEMKIQVKEVGEDLKVQMQKINSGISISDITKVMKEVIASMPQASNTIVMREVKKNLAEETGVEINELDERLLADIHARAVNELVKESKTEYIDYKKAKSVDNIDNNVSELEGLLEL